MPLISFYTHENIRKLEVFNIYRAVQKDASSLKQVKALNALLNGFKVNHMDTRAMLIDSVLVLLLEILTKHFFAEQLSLLQTSLLILIEMKPISRESCKIFSEKPLLKAPLRKFFLKQTVNCWLLDPKIHLLLNLIISNTLTQTHPYSIIIFKTLCNHVYHMHVNNFILTTAMG